MKTRIFTFLVAFLATMSGAVWGQGTYYVGNNTNDKLTIQASCTIEMAQGIQKSNDQIIIEGNKGEITLTLKNVDIDVRLREDTKTGGSDSEVDNTNAGNCAMEINSGTTVTLIWEGTNKLWSSSQRAGINVKPGATLILKGPDDESKGTLEAGSLCNSPNGTTYGAGIGGDGYNPNFGTIIIESGKITAISQAKVESNISINAAGIGGGYGLPETTQKPSTEGTILIKGGNVTAKCENVNGSIDNGAGIGGGYQGTCSNITILGGYINAESQDGNDIGNGADHSSGTPAKPILIIAPTEKDKAPEFGNEVEIVDAHNQLKVDNGNTTLNGNVSLPKGTQIYAPNINGEGTLNAYNIKLTNEKQIKALDELTQKAKKQAKIEYMDDRYNPDTIQKKLSKQVDDATGGAASKIKEQAKKNKK